MTDDRLVAVTIPGTHPPVAIVGTGEEFLNLFVRPRGGLASRPMSYSLSVSATTKDQILAALDERAAEAVTVANEDVRDAMTEHLEAIAAAVEQVLPFLGRDGDLVAVNVSGHANPDHAPAEGWTLEHISVSLSVHVPAPTEQEDEPAVEAVDGPDATPEG